MEIKGSNITTLNKSGLTKDLQLSHRGVNIELKTTKQGIAIVCGMNTQIVKNGTTLVAVKKDKQLEEFETMIIKNGMCEDG